MVVEDDCVSAELVAKLAGKAGFEVDVFGSCEEVEDRLGDAGETCPWHLMILDLGLPDGDGIGLMQKIQGRYPRLPCVMLTARDRAEDAVRALKAGAVDYVVKPIVPAVFFERIRGIVDQGELRRPAEIGFDEGFVWRSPSMLRVRELFRQAVVSDRPLLIEGEPGLDKVRLARRVHDLTTAEEAKWVEIDCGSGTSDELFSRLFGGEVERAGALEGHMRRVGVLESPHPATVVLRRFEHLDPEVQEALLERLKLAALPPGCRLVAVSDRSLRQLLGLAELDEDLVYRLSVLHLALPPLRERVQDLVAYWEYCLARECVAQKVKRPMLDRAAKNWIADYRWPANLFEVRASVKAVLAAALDGEITAAHFEEQLPHWRHRLGDPGLGQTSDRLRDLEKEALIQALRAVKGNRRRAAKALGVSLRTVYNMLDRHELREMKF